ncbi:MAG: M23 family metallopeptidase [Chloroflexi bacterium]|nr:M23 family metallopeptidase [Chloroflexota bacterium]
MIRLLAPLAVVVFLLPSVGRAQASAYSAYKLPVPAGQSIYLTQGNSSSYNHTSANGSEWAFDFATRGNKPFDVVASRGGKVIGARTDSSVQCSEANRKTDGTELKGCWKEANFVLIDHGDGTSALYLHLEKDSVLTSEGKEVRRGEPIATAGATGWSEVIHLHFQVETTPSLQAQNDKPKGWWWNESVGISFSDKDVLAKRSNGVPTKDSSPYVSDNSPSSVPVPGGVWISPSDRSNLVQPSLHFAARAYTANPGDPEIDRVNFTAWWPSLGQKTSPWKIACTANQASSGDTYECDVDLAKIGAIPGELRVSFDVYNRDGIKNLSPNGERIVTYKLATPTPPPLPSSTPTVAPTLAQPNIITATPTGPAPSWRVVYQADWSGGPDSWTGDRAWRVADGMLVNDGTSIDWLKGITAPYVPDVADYAVEAEIRQVNDSGCMSYGIIGRQRLENGWGIHAGFMGCGGAVERTSTWSGARSAPGTGAYLQARDNGNGAIARFNAGQSWHTYRLEIIGANLRLLVDGSVTLELTDNHFPSPGRVGIWSDRIQTQIRSFRVLVSSSAVPSTTPTPPIPIPSTTVTTPTATGFGQAPVVAHSVGGRADCTVCHFVGAPGVGQPGGLGIPPNHRGRTNNQCFDCHPR